ncbi:MAG: redox-sensing transcriptional repressor Rex [Coprobacillus cateniformis]|uniref:redox-sensing transcriptional repressor Rex n=1 Tax=Longibaculum muris TaxID=1796628 RepID=UPI003AB58797|nr:redox-sensing transcriptional repressor Rex [Coprobacillus cateniformis]
MNNVEKKHQKISKATMSRFPRYLKALRNMQHEGKENFLSSELAEATGILDTTIRRDFGFLTDKESLGKRGIGYDTKEIINILNNVLGLGLDEPIILIGVGNLGSAILKYNRWQYTVGKIVCGYDQDQNKVGERFGVKLNHIDDLEKTFPKGCKIAILAISDKVQETVDRLMELGVKGIVDFTHTHFTVNDDVVVQTVDVVVAIQELVLKMHANDE